MTENKELLETKYVLREVYIKKQFTVIFGIKCHNGCI